MFSSCNWHERELVLLNPDKSLREVKRNECHCLPRIGTVNPRNRTEYMLSMTEPFNLAIDSWIKSYRDVMQNPHPLFPKNAPFQNGREQLTEKEG